MRDTIRGVLERGFRGPGLVPDSLDEWACEIERALVEQGAGAAVDVGLAILAERNEACDALVELQAEVPQLVRLGGQVPTEAEGYVWSTTGLGGLREDQVPHIAALLRGTQTQEQAQE
jgi:hypothetical protein